MNELQINIIRDAALFIKSSSPELAFDLISLARDYRKNGPLINKVYHNLKSDLGIVNILLVGNCQVIALANLLKFKSTKLRVKHIVVHEDKVSNNCLAKEVDNSDFVISQKISNSFNNLSTENLKGIAGEKLILIHNLYYDGYHPDWCYLPVIKGVRLKSPIGDYHNKTVIDGFSKNLSALTIKENINSKKFNSLHYTGSAETSISEMEKREHDIDIKMVESLKNKIGTSTKLLFYTFNHPCKLLLNEETNKILEHIGIKSYRVNFTGDCLDDVKLPVNILNTIIGITPLVKDQKEIDIDQFIVDSIAIYSENINYVKLYLDR